MVALIAMITFYLWLNSEMTNSRALRLSAFNVVSIVTGTGYATADYNLWGPRYGGKPLPEAVVFSVMSYFFLFFMTFAAVAIALSIIGLDPITAWSGAGSAVANVGPGLGDIIGPSGTYQSLPGEAKWVLLIAMIVGRLEIVTALVVITPAFWKA